MVSITSLSHLRGMSKKIMSSHTGIDGKESCGRHKDSVKPKGNLGHLNVLDSGTMTCLYSETLDQKDSEIKLCLITVHLR